MSAAPAGTVDDRDSYSFLKLLALVLQRRRLLIGLPVAVAVVALAISLVVPKEFTAESRFMPEEDQAAPSEMAGLAAQFGIVPGGQAESLDFYIELLRSHELLRQVVLTPYVVPVDEGADTLRGDLIELYDIDGDTPEDRLQAAVIQVRDEDIIALPRRGANLVSLETQAPWPALAESLNRRMLELVNRFNLERRQSSAAAERRFLEERLAQAQQELREAENALQTFVARNRRYTESPETLFEHGRLQREVTFRQEIYASRAQGLERATVEAVRNTPVITVVDGPEGTALKTAPRPVINVLLGLVLGLALAVTILIAGELMESARRSRPDDYSELSQATRETLADLRPGTLLRRLGFRNGRERVSARAAAGEREEP